MKILEKIYLSSPNLVQSILVSILNGYKSYERRSGDYKLHLSTISENDFKKKYDLEVNESIELERITNIAVSNTKIQNSGFCPVRGEKEAFSDFFLRIPPLQKSRLKKNYDVFVNNFVNADEVLSTTGSTGTPLKIPCTIDSRQKNYAFFDNFLLSHGFDHKQRKVTIAGRKIVSSGSMNGKYWVYDFWTSTLFMSAYHLSPNSIPQYVKKLCSFKPEFIDSYPSVLFEIASYAIANDVELYSPKFICTSSESLSEEYRRVIEQAFNCKVRDQYGAAEMCIFGYECVEGHMHVRSDYSYVEILDDDDNVVPDGVVGNITCTGFLNESLPLIRYQIGDLGSIIRNHSCRCGSSHPILSQLVGRKDDSLVSKSDRKFTRLSPILKGFDILESQFVQISKERLEVRIVIGEGSESIKERVSERIHTYFDDEFIIEIRFVDNIPRGPGGKFRSVIGL